MGSIFLPRYFLVVLCVFYSEHWLHLLSPRSLSKLHRLTSFESPDRMRASLIGDALSQMVSKVDLGFFLCSFALHVV
jgi:hypothetical protein